MSDVTPAGASRFTDEQIAAIIADNHLLIEAGAGSGKTTTLVEKIVYQLGAETAQGRRVAGPCTLDQIVAITFTNAAAADLKRKLRVRLRREAARTGDARWTAMVYEVDRALIGTIHSFCAGVLRQYALRLGLDPHFAVLEEHESTSLRDECAREIMMTALGDMDATAIALTVASGLQRATAIVASVASDALRARAALDAWQHDGTARTSALATRMRDLATAWDAGEDQTVWKDTTDADATKLALWVLRAGCAARELMHQRCDAMGALDFDALISRTRDALDGDSSVLAALHAHLSWVFIDEFQDTDPAQLEIGYRLCGLDMKSGAAAAVPRLCIIGDPKQSIYRFRHADVSVWGKVVQRFAALGIEPVGLTRNFRSRAPIVGLVNATFDGLIGQGRQAVLDEGHEIPFVALGAHRDTPGDDGIVEIVRIAADEKVDVQRAEEAAWIVGRIQQMVEHEKIVLDDDGDVAVSRKPRWSDFALLFRARTGLEIYESAFRAAGIPCVVSGGRGFFETRAVLDVQLLLAALIDPFDNLAWFGLLRSPFIGLRDESVLRFALENRGSPLSAILDQGAMAPLEGDCLESGRQWIATLKALRDRVSVAVLIRHALDSSGYAAQAMFRTDGDSAVANLHKLARIADAQPDLSVAEFLAQMRQRAETSRSEAEAPLYTAGEDVVTLTTVHSAKGLEWSVVFLCNLRRNIDSTNAKANIYFDAGAGVGTNLLGISAAHDLLHVRERALARSEEKRLWYVAMTRARDYLVLCMPDAPSAAEGDSSKNVTSLASGAGEEPKQVHEWLCRALGATEPMYEYRGRRWTARKTIAETPSGAQHAFAVDVAVERALPTPEELDGAMPLPPDVCKHVQSVYSPETCRLVSEI